MNPTRRKFIKNTGLGVLSFVFLNPFRRLAAFTEGETPKWEDLIETARWCPTVHNLQPHKVKIISTTEAELYYDPKRLLPVGDPDSIFATVATGIFIEHLSIVASAYNYKVDIADIFEPITTKAKSNTHFAKLTLVPSTRKETLEVDLIKKRKTSRVNYKCKVLKPSTINKLKDQAKEFGMEFFHSNDEHLIDELIDLNQKTLFEDLSSKANREELDNLFRYSKEDAEAKKDGLWAKCMGFKGGLMKSVFQNHERWTKGLRKRLLRKIYKASFKCTCSVCWIGSKFENTTDWVNAGRFFARNWLLLTKEEACLQPMGSLVTNEGAYKKIKEVFTAPSKDKKLWMIYRAGYSNEPTRSYRLPTEELILK